MESPHKAAIYRGQKLQDKKKQHNNKTNKIQYKNECILTININAFGHLHNQSNLLLMQLTTNFEF